MHIAYSCTGEGFGHAARMVVIARLLEKSHRVSYFVPKSVKRFLEEKIPDFRCEEIPHFAFAKRGGGVDLAGTVVKNLPNAWLFPERVGRLARRLRASGVDAIISDFDPHLAWAGRAAGIPVLQINHPGIIAKHLSPDPRSWFPAVGAFLMEGPWDERIHISFYGGDAGPLFRQSLFQFPVHDAGYLLFYMQEPYRREVARVLSRFPDLPVRMFPSPGENFEEALAGCRAVVASAGHQIIAESIRLGKPILVVPRKGQWEQTINARMLEKTGAGAWTTTKDLRRDLPLFLESLRSYSRIPDMPQGFTVNDGIGELERRIRRFLHACSLRGRCPGGKIRRNCGKAAAA